MNNIKTLKKNKGGNKKKTKKNLSLKKKIYRIAIKEILAKSKINKKEAINIIQKSIDIIPDKVKNKAENILKINTVGDGKKIVVNGKNLIELLETFLNNLEKLEEEGENLKEFTDEEIHISIFDNMSNDSLSLFSIGLHTLNLYLDKISKEEGDIENEDELMKIENIKDGNKKLKKKNRMERRLLTELYMETIKDYKFDISIRQKRKILSIFSNINKKFNNITKIISDDETSNEYNYKGGNMPSDEYRQTQIKSIKRRLNSRAFHYFTIFLLLLCGPLGFVFLLVSYLPSQTNRRDKLREQLFHLERNIY